MHFLLSFIVDACNSFLLANSSLWWFNSTPANGSVVNKESQDAFYPHIFVRWRYFSSPRSTVFTKRDQKRPEELKCHLFRRNIGGLIPAKFDLTMKRQHKATISQKINVKFILHCFMLVFSLLITVTIQF